ELARAGLHQRCQLLRCIPTRSPVVEHYRQHRRQEASGAELLAVDQVLIQKADVGVKAHGHVALDRGLELEQQVDVDPSRSPSNAPDDIVAALAQVVADITAGDSLERTVVELLEPRLLDEALEQIAHHPRMGEQQLVTMIVIGQQLSSRGAVIVCASQGSAARTRLTGDYSARCMKIVRKPSGDGERFDDEPLQPSRNAAAGRTPALYRGSVSRALSIRTPR